MERARTSLSLPSPTVSITWNNPLWDEVATLDSKPSVAGPNGLQSRFCRLLQSALSSMSFDFHDVHLAPSVCGNVCKPDAVISLRGKTVCPLTTGAIIILKPQGESSESAKNVGHAIMYGRIFLQQLPSTLPETVVVALIDLKSITLIRVRLPKSGQLAVDFSPLLPDAKHVLLQLLCCQPASLEVQLPDLGPALQITGFLGYGATSHVFSGTTSSGQEVSIAVLHDLHTNSIVVEW